MQDAESQALISRVSGFTHDSPAVRRQNGSHRRPSPNPLRASHFVGYYLQRHGYRIVPVNPKERRFSARCYPR
jgi:hypothetical protein